MSIRIFVCGLVCLYFCYYAWRNCFVSTCAAVLLMAIMQHPDVISEFKSIGGIPGLNLWNVLLANCFLAWRSQRRTMGWQWDMPRNFQTLLILYIIVLLISALRLLIFLPHGMTAGDVLSEHIVNTVKWVVPCIILFDTCRTRQRVVVASIILMCLYFLLAIQVVKHVPIKAAVSDDFQLIAAKMVQSSTGYNRVTLSMMLGGASWAALAALGLARTRKQRWLSLACAGVILLGQSLTGGRSGYVSWGLVGLALCIARWRKLLPVIPAAAIAVCLFLPAVRDRMLQGIGFGNEATNVYEATSGRNIAWPYVIEKIKESPVLGFGCEAMYSTGLFQRILDETDGGELFPHPHNAYLEILLNTGLIGFFVIIPFYGLVVKRSFGLFLDRSDPLFEVAGGICCALVLALLVGSMGGQTFYPREGSVGMWAAIGVMLRMSVERDRSRFFGIAMLDDEEDKHVAPLEIVEEESFANL